MGKQLKSMSLALIALILAPVGAAAQEPAPGGDSERVITPPRTPRGPLPPRPDKVLAPIDWEAVRALIRTTRERDAAFDRQQSQSLTAARLPLPRPGGLRPIAPQRFPRLDPREVLKTRLPLLLPIDPAIAQTLRVTAREHSYAATAQLPDGGEIEFLGTRLRVVGGGDDVAKLRQAQRRRFMDRLEGLDAPFILSRHEEGVDLSFSKFGASYLVTIRCPDPDGDARCAESDFVRSLVENLSIVNEAEGDGE